MDCKDRNMSYGESFFNVYNKVVNNVSANSAPNIFPQLSVSTIVSHAVYFNTCHEIHKTLLDSSSIIATASRLKERIVK